jgi:signal transduction histidine kinase
VFLQTRFDAADGWRIDVSDNGPGIAPQDRDKIFSLFESSKGMRGTGLGLPVSAKIMREHGGNIEVMDSELGRGTCFRLRLPTRDTMIEPTKGQETAWRSGGSVG